MDTVRAVDLPRALRRRKRLVKGEEAQMPVIRDDKWCPKERWERLRRYADPITAPTAEDRSYARQMLGIVDTQAMPASDCSSNKLPDIGSHFTHCDHKHAVRHDLVLANLLRPRSDVLVLSARRRRDHLFTTLHTGNPRSPLGSHSKSQVFRLGLCS